MRSTIASFASLLLASLATAGTIPGYGDEVLSWTIPIPDGSTVVLNGTVQEVYSQLAQNHPEVGATVGSETSKRDAAMLGKRDNVICNNWPLGSTTTIRDGISYLRGLGGTASNGPGPGNCGRVSCSYDSAIWWCNDNTFTKTVTWNNIADGAQLIVNTCSPTIPSVSGQDFHSDGWNVIVRQDFC